MRLLSYYLSLSACGLLAACTQLPVSGPSSQDIAANATSAVVADRRSVVFDYVLLDINQPVLENLVDVGDGSLYRTFGTWSGPAPVLRVGVGDILQISIFESSTGGLFIPAEAGVRPGNFVTLPNQQVDRTGTITVPFAGDVQVVGRTLVEIQRDIQARLANRAIEPQIIVTLVDQNAAEVAIVGEVAGGANKFRLRLGGDRILDIIAKSGGLKYPGYELYVTLQRGKKRATVYFPTLVSKSTENIFLAPGDTIYVYHEPQKFVAVGALGGVGQTSGLTGQYAFGQEKLSLNEAVAKAGGLLDTRADPGEVFLYRIEYREALKRMGVDLAKFPPEQKFIPTVYRANYRDPSSFFFVQSFEMRDKDIIYVSNARSVEVMKVLDYIRAVTSLASGVANDYVVTRVIAD